MTALSAHSGGAAGRVRARPGRPILRSALLRLPDGDFDLIIVSLSLQDADGLRLCSQVRSLDRARHLPILIIAEPGDDAPLLRGLDMGVNDYVVRPIDPNELLARVRTQRQAQALYRPFARCGSSRASRWPFSTRSPGCTIAAT